MVFAQLNGSKYCYVSLTIDLNISHLFTHIKWSTNSISNDSIKQKSFICTEVEFQTEFYLTNRSGATTPVQKGLGSNDNEGVLHIPQISKARALPSDGFISYPGRTV